MKSCKSGKPLKPLKQKPIVPQKDKYEDADPSPYERRQTTEEDNHYGNPYGRNNEPQRKSISKYSPHQYGKEPSHYDDYNMEQNRNVRTPKGVQNNKVEAVQYETYAHEDEDEEEDANEDGMGILDDEEREKMDVSW